MMPGALRSPGHRPTLPTTRGSDANRSPDRGLPPDPWARRHLRRSVPLGASAPLTHLIVAALHIADDGTVILNDHPVDDDYHTQLWDQLDAVRSRGVRVLAMVGGWAPGTMCKLDGESLSIYYPGLRLSLIHI